MLHPISRASQNKDITIRTIEINCELKYVVFIPNVQYQITLFKLKDIQVMYSREYSKLEQRYMIR